MTIFAFAHSGNLDSSLETLKINFTLYFSLMMSSFSIDPLTPKSHEPDVNNVVKLCDTHNIPLATNLATAELLIRALDRGDLEWREMYK